MDFMEGAKHAFFVTHTAISSPDFSDFSSGYLFNIYCSSTTAYNRFFLSFLFINRFKSESSSASLLKRVLHPKIYQAALDGCKQLQEEGIVTTFESIVIKNHTLVEIRVHLAEDKEGREEDDEEVMMAKEEGDGGGQVKDQKKKEEEKEGNKEEKEKEGNKEDLSSSSFSSSFEEYPAGGVLATVSVAFATSERYSTRHRDLGDFSSQRENVTTWTFRGCLSGQSSLDWRVIAFDGVGAL